MSSIDIDKILRDKNDPRHDLAVRLFIDRDFKVYEHCNSSTGPCSECPYNGYECGTSRIQ